MFARLFLAHPRSVGESYFEHQQVAFSFAGSLLVAGFGCLLHALIPGFCERTASSRIAMLHTRMVTDRGGGLSTTANSRSGIASVKSPV